jgi:hypothetical protein
MRTSLAALLMATLGWTCSALGASGDIQLTSMREEGKTLVEFLLPLKRAAALPKWEPSQGDPPLSQQRAVEIARSELERRKLPVAEYRLQYVSLNRILEGPYEHLWYYSVEFLPNPPHVPKPFWTTIVVVLIDGSIVSATPAK